MVVDVFLLTYQIFKEESILMKKYMGMANLESAWTRTVINKFPAKMSRQMHWVSPRMKEFKESRGSEISKEENLEVHMWMT